MLSTKLFRLFSLEFVNVLPDLFNDAGVELLPVAEEEHDLQQDEQGGRQESLKVVFQDVNRLG